MKLVFICIICRQITQITCPLIQVTARFVGRIRVLTLQHTLLGHKNFCFRLVVYKQTHTPPKFIVYARSTTTRKYLINLPTITSLANLFSLYKRQGNPTVEFAVKKVLPGISPSCKPHLISAVHFGNFLYASMFQLGGLDYKDSTQVFCQSKYDKTISLKLLLLYLNFCDSALLYTFSSIHLNTFYCCQLI